MLPFMGCLKPPPTSPPLAAIEVLELNCQAASMAFRSHSLLYRFIEVSAGMWHVTVLVYPCYLPRACCGGCAWQQSAMHHGSV